MSCCWEVGDPLVFLAQKNVSKKVALTDASAIDKDLSYCYSKSTNATLVIVPDDGDDEMGTFRIIFRFTGVSRPFPWKEK